MSIKKGAGSIDVKEFGAKGDGVTDDTTAIQTAVSAAASGLGGGVVLFPAGIYKITTTISYTSTTNPIYIKGAGINRSIIYASNCNAMIINADNSTIKDISFQTNATAAEGLKVTGNYLTVQNVKFEGYNPASYWINCLHTQNLWYSKMDNIVCVGGALNTDTRGTGILAEYSVNNYVTNSQFLALNYCIYISNTPRPSDSIVCEGWAVSNSTLITSNYGFYATAGTFFDVNNNVIDIINNIAVYFAIAGTGSINNNWIALSSSKATSASYGIQIASGDRVTVSGNHISGIGTNTGIYVQSDYHTITGNVLFTLSIGIWLTHNYCTVTANSCVLCSTNSIKSDGNSNMIFNNSLGGTATAGLLGTSNVSQPMSYSRSIVLTLPSTGTSTTVNIPIPSGRFSSKPFVGLMTANGVQNYTCQYLPDDASTTATNAKFQVTMPNGGTMVGGGVRFSVYLQEAELT